MCHATAVDPTSAVVVLATTQRFRLRQGFAENPVVLRVVVWILFGAIASCAPLLTHWIDALDDVAKYSVRDDVGHGELLLVSAILAIGALGEILAAGSDKSYRLAAIITSFVCVVLIGISLMRYGDLTSKIRTATAQGNDSVQYHNLAGGVLLTFGFTVFCGCAVMVLAELTRLKETREQVANAVSSARKAALAGTAALAGSEGGQDGDNEHA